MFENATELLKIEYVSVLGLLLFFCGYLMWRNTKLEEKLRDKDEKIQDFIEKYYTISTKLYEFIDKYGRNV